MKKIITVIVVLLVGFGLYTYFSQKNMVQAPNTDTTNMTGDNQSIYIPKTTFTGTKNVALLKSTFNWQGQKTVLKEWIDKGFIDVQSGYLTFDKGYISGGEVVMNMNTIKAVQTGSGGGQDQLSTHLKSKDFFNAEQFPTAKLVITKVENNMMSGDLTIKDVTKPVSFPITIMESDTEFVVSGQAAIDRSMFGVEFGSTSFIKDLADKAIIDDVFTLTFKLVLE